MRHHFGTALVLAVASTDLEAQTHAPTPADYERARRFLAPSLTGLVVGGSVTPVWTADGRFWYRNSTLAGDEIVVIDPAKKARARCDAKATQCEGIAIAADTGSR